MRIQLPGVPVLLLTAALLLPCGQPLPSYLLSGSPGGTGISITMLQAAEPPAAISLKDGDRVVLLGGAFVERLQADGYLESLLTSAHPDRKIVYRNLGWSGDTVTGIARAVFGGPADGFARLEKDVRAAKPTVILVGYGANEAYAGPAGLADFQASLSHLLDTLQTTGARLVLLSPSRRLKLPPLGPDPQSYNRDLNAYCDVLRGEAQRRQLPYVDLVDLLEAPTAAGPAADAARLSDNGLHLTSWGNWFAAPRLAQRLGAPTASWNVQLKVDGLRAESAGCTVRDFKPTDNGYGWQVTDHQLGYSAPPASSPTAGAAHHPLAPAGKLTIQGLPPGKYQLLIDEQPILFAANDQWQQGVDLPHRGDGDQVERLRGAIQTKNELYFHHYRPQNETYLFLFRKHEQGNNAVEIAQFEPLIADLEQFIQQASRPVARQYALRPVPAERPR